MGKQFVGIDIAKASLQVCLLAQPALQAEFENNKTGHKALLSWLKKQVKGEVLIGMEATGTYGETVCESLYAQGYAVAVINPARVKAYAQSKLKRHKTDAIDAELIADFCRSQEPPLWSPPSPEERELRDLLRHLEDLKASRQAEKNRLEAQPRSKTVQADLLAHIRFLEAQIAEVEKEIRNHINQHPHLKEQRDLIKSIPGLGDLSAARIMAELGDLRRFSDVRQIVALTGLNPQQRQSGSSMHYTAGISRMGRSNLRAALYMPALSAMRHNPILRPFAERLLKQGLKKKQVLVAVMRKLLHLAYGVVKNQVPFNPNYLVLGS